MTTPTDDNVVSLQLADPRPPINITFTENDGEVVGVFEYNRKTRKWSFEGDLETSACKFLAFLNDISGAH